MSVKMCVQKSRAVFEVIRNPLGLLMMVMGALLAFAAATSVCKADDISDVSTAVGGYVTAAIVVGSAIILFVLGKRVLRRLIAFALMLGGIGLGFAAFTSNALAVDDITTVTTSVSGYVTAAIVVGSAVILFVLGKRVLRRLI